MFDRVLGATAQHHGLCMNEYSVSLCIHVRYLDDGSVFDKAVEINELT